MPIKRKYVLFLSHAAEDSELAKEVHALLNRSLRCPPRSHLVFRATEHSAIESGADYYEAIIAALRESSVCLTLITPNSLHRPWLAYESGGAYAVFQGRSRSNRLIPLLAKGVTNRLLPSPYQRFQTRDLSNRDDIAGLVTDLARFLRTTVSTNPQSIRRIATLAGSQGQQWESVEPVLVARSSDRSPYNVSTVLRLARRHILLFGQNLHWVARSPDVHDAIISFLKDEKSRKVYIAICDARNSAAVTAWTTVNPDLEPTYPYRQQLLESTEAFRSLRARCRAAKASGFSVHTVDLIPFGATVMDPGSPEGIMTLHPMINHAAKASERPQFLICRRTNRELFDYYWRSLQFMWDYSRPL